MMESSNLDLEQEDFHGSSSSSSLPTPHHPFHFVGRSHDWNQDLLLNSDAQFMPTTNGVVLQSTPRDFMRLMTHGGMPMVQDLGFQWASNDQDQGYTKEELRPAAVDHHDYRYKNVDDTLAVGPDVGFDPMGNLCSMVLPTANISGSNRPLPTPYASSLGMDVRALDLLASGRFGRTLCQSSIDGMALLREDMAYGGGRLQEPAQNKTTPPSTVGGVCDQRCYRANDVVGSEYKVPQKKPRLESRASFTPFKVRKEKLGDRIAALQQLVAPFGKTDTASVLMEAIGYIKFLQDQVETLSVPYMRSCNNKKIMRTSSEETSSGQQEEPKLDLRSRGLCLVPLSCTSYVTNDNGVWSPPSYRGGT